MSQRLTLEEVFERFSDEHGDYYDYSLVDYRGKAYKIKIICPIHGEFEQPAGDHMEGHGCRKCGNKSSSLKRTKTTSRFIREAKEVHSDKNYDYSLVDFKGAILPIDIICPIHGVFPQRPNDHLNGSGCPDCGNLGKSLNKFLTLEEVLTRFFEEHGNYYDYSAVIYKGTETLVDIICPIHGTFPQRPVDHFAGHGCPDCANYGFNPDKPAILYYIKDTTTGYYKIGITNRTVKERFSAAKLNRIKIINIESFEVGRDALDIEKSLHARFDCFRVTNLSWKEKRSYDGYKEFFIIDVLDLDSPKLLPLNPSK